jgi:hypothetical protein
MPGTRLTATEVAALAGLDVTTCRILLDALERTHFLVRRGPLFIRRSPDSPAA